MTRLALSTGTLQFDIWWASLYDSGKGKRRNKDSRAKCMDIIEVLQRTLEKNRDKVLFAYLFGSLADGRGGPLSDVDVAVFLADETASDHWDARLSLQADFSRALRRNDVDVLILNHTHNLMLLDEIIRRGVVLLDQDRQAREDFELKVLHRAIDFKTQRAAIVGF